MKKIIGLALIATLTLAGCSATEEPAETAAPAPSTTSQPAPEEANETVEPAETDEYIQGVYLAGFGEDSYNEADKVKVLALLAGACDAAQSQGVVEDFGDSKVVLFSDADGYEGYTAFYETADSSDLVYSLDYFFNCFLAMDYDMFTESGESDLSLFPISVAEVADQVFQVKYDLGDGSYYTSQYKFASGLLYEVVSNPEESAPFTMVATYGKPSAENLETLKALVDAL
jgi:hypothetical protein